MIRTLGDVLKMQFPETPDDITLFIDITGKDLEELVLLSPVSTYLITTRPLFELKRLISLGFYNLLYGVTPKNITKSTILGFLNTRYEDNRIKVVLDNLIPLYKEYGNTVGCIEGLLRALKTGDLGRIDDIVRYNVDTMLSVCSTIDAMAVLAETLQKNATSITNMEKQLASFKVGAAESEIYRDRSQKLVLEVENLRAELKGVTTEYQALQVKYSSAINDNASVLLPEETPAYKRLSAELAQLRKANEQLESDCKRLQMTTTTVGEGAPADAKDKLIQTLKQELAEVRSQSYTERMVAHLPVITDNIHMQASNVIYIKEVKTQIYINALLYWMDNALRLKYAEPNQKTFLIVVLDPLIDQYRMRKYTKRGWAQNTLPNRNSHVVVTNNVTLDFLKVQLNVDKYDLVVVVDRLGVFPDAVVLKSMHRYSLISTPMDIDDFKLDREKCIGFFEQSPAQFCRYNICPGDPKLATVETSRRAYKMLSDKVFTAILAEIGVMPNDN